MSVRPPERSEFPEGADLPPDEMSRRELLALVGVGAAGAALQGCIQSPTETILPYTRHPGPIVPGLPLFYATAMVLDGYATGLLVRAREGRPIKIEGNPDHPASLGGSGVLEQASILGLYDSRRTRHLRHGDQPTAWHELRRRFGASESEAPDYAREANHALRADESGVADGAGSGRDGYHALRPDQFGAADGARRDGGAGLAFLLEPTGSPLRARLLERIRVRFPASQVYFHAAAAPQDIGAASTAVLGARLDPHYDFTRAERVLAVGSDFVAEGPFHLRWARDFAATRRPASANDPVSRLYAVESHPTPTGTIADVRLRARASEQPRVLAAIASELGARSPELDRAAEALAPRQREVASAAARDLAQHRGKSLVIAGPRLDAAAHALAMWINHALGNVGATVWYAAPALIADPTPARDLAELARAIEAGAIDTLVIAGVNPVATAPGDVPFAELLAHVGETVYLADYEDETAARCRWVIGAAHWLESWGDARAYDGTVSLIQPLIAPLFGGRTADELLAVFAGEEDRGAYDLLREQWPGGASDSQSWDRALERGLIDGTAFERQTPAAALDAALRLAEPLAASASGALEIELRRDPKLHDGRFAANLWLQELPDPSTQLTWGNAVMLSPATANAHGIEHGALVELAAGGRSLHGPALIVPGHADGAVTVQLGHGRRSAAEPAADHGFDAYPLRTAASPHLARDATVRALAASETTAHERQRHQLATTQTHWTLDGRDEDIAIHRTLEQWREGADVAPEQRAPQPTFYQWKPDLRASEHARDQWAMTIDLSACTGCNACMVACQAENNIQIVGKDGVRKGREMHWIRIDRYLTGPPDEPVTLHQPMLCQHCERAPCEYVCPVFATAHSTDGLNEMVYNRCVGTRFCSNNCPYKVRRFNWFDYGSDRDEVAALVWNPEVTVRERGVMEKCTYCVQRIRAGQIQAQLEGDRALADGEVVPACVQACPSRAIVFGSLTDPQSEVSRSRSSPRLFSVLHELGTEPRTRYLARISNPLPELDPSAGGVPAVPAGAPERDEEHSPPEAAR